MIKFSAICPHPPLIVPGIGTDNESSYLKKTIHSMEMLSKNISLCDIDTIIVISPHGLVYPDRMNIWYGGELDGDFKKFERPDIYLEFLSNDKLAQEICDSSDKNGILVNHYTENFELDHGTMVPMVYLAKHLPEDIKLVPINYSYLSAETHYKFGQTIGNICQKRQENIAIIASGDLSHKLFDNDNVSGKVFDTTLLKDLANKNIDNILSYDEDWVIDAGECGYKSIVTLLGAINNINYYPQVLSYESPFGIGYSVVNFKL